MVVRKDKQKKQKNFRKVNFFLIYAYNIIKRAKYNLIKRATLKIFQLSNYILKQARNSKLK